VFLYDNNTKLQVQQLEGRECVEREVEKIMRKLWGVGVNFRDIMKV